MNETEQRSLGFVLRGLEFPAHRWEILTAAQWYGADETTTRRLRALPARDHPYRDLGELVATLEQTGAA